MYSPLSVWRVQEVIVSGCGVEGYVKIRWPSVFVIGVTMLLSAHSDDSDVLWLISSDNFPFRSLISESHVCSYVFIYASAPLGGANAYMFYRCFFCFLFFFCFFVIRHNDSA